MKLDLKALGTLKPVKFVKKNLPEIMVAVGVGGVIFTVVDACKKTLELEDVVDEIKSDISSVHEKKAITNEEEYPEKEINKDLAVAYVKGGVSIAKLYARPVICGVVSISCIIGSHHILKRRNVALLAAYETLDTSYRKYRMRVKEKYGEETERKLAFGREFEEVVVDKDGKEKTKKVEKLDPSNLSPYTVIFDETCPAWDRDAEYNKMFLISCQNHANDLLNVRGHLFLNEVRDMLDLPHTAAGQMVGWLKEGDGDGFVDFGIFDANSWKKRDFVNGYEHSIILDFNVDGVIWDKI